jgi:hypothetical protein
MSRHNYKWTINELLSLHREYELLRLPIQLIASKHKRTTQSIIHKLIEEELFYINDDGDYSSANDDGEDNSSANDDLYDDEEDEEEEEDEDEDLNSDTVWVTDDTVLITEDTLTEKKELPEDDKNVEYIYIHQYVWNVFCNYFFPDKISYRYKLL